MSYVCLNTLDLVSFLPITIMVRVIMLHIPYFLECFSPSNCIRPLIVFAQQSGLNVYCVRPRIVFARCSKCCACAIVIRKDNPLSGKVSFNRKVKSVWMVRKKWQKKLQM